MTMPRITCLLLALLFAATAYAQQRVTYTVRAGDTLFGISQRYQVSVSALRQANGIEGDIINVGQVLTIPAKAGVETAEQPSVQAPPVDQDAPPGTIVPGDSTGFALYSVRPGETFYSIANRFGTQAYQLFTLNDGRTAPLEPGRFIRLPAELASQTYRIRRGDTLYGIAEKFAVSVSDLRRANHLVHDALVEGKELLIPAKGSIEQRSSGTLPPVEATGPVLPYPDTFQGRLTASGMTFDSTRYSVSHRKLPFHTIVLLTNPEVGTSTFAVVNDRGPVDDAYEMEVSQAVARALKLEQDSDVALEIRVIK